jgi:catalase
MGVTPEQAMDAIRARFGAHAGHRALHAKGVICTGTFTATPEAARLTRAAHMGGAPIPATIRFSNGGGNPKVPDYAPDVRGMAVSFRLPDGSSTDIVSQTVPRFPFRNEDGFVELLRATTRSPAAVYRVPLLLMRNPGAILGLRSNLKALGALPASFASRPYFAFHAFKWIAADGSERWVRYTWRPTISEPDLEQTEAKQRGRDYLFDDLRERLDRAPVRMTLEVQIAEPGDDPDDPSSVWPEERERVVVGILEVSAIDPDADDGIVFDPMHLTEGVEPSNDPVLRFRPRVYSLSYAERAAG